MAWKAFSSDEIERIVADKPSFIERPGERQCPTCGEATLRHYSHKGERSTGPTRISYLWCTPCQRFWGGTTRADPNLTYNDPLDDYTIDEANRYRQDIELLFPELDRLWEQGALPQTFSDSSQGR